MKDISQILEFDKIKNQILKYNVNPLSRKIIEQMEPFYNKVRVQEELNKTSEGYKIVNLGTLPSLTRLVDLSSYLEILEKNGTLTTIEIYEFLHHFNIIKDLKEFNKNKKDEFYYFDSYVNQLAYVYEIVDRITSCIGEDYNILDNASSDLKKIRKNIKVHEDEIKNKMQGFLSSHSDMLTDSYVASRKNRLVLPIKASYKNNIKGVVVDVSDSGLTYFIEPYEVVNLNLELESLHQEEEIEIRRIIKALCLLIAKSVDKIRLNNELLTEISFIVLKGRYGLASDYEIASLNDSYLELINARHPLIDKNKVVSNDFILGKDNSNILVISGPNAGGKTVSLKTVGLLVYMNQCGLPIPVRSASLKVFSNIFVDIGDDQSIEESLSGFTSHIINVSHILNKMDKDSLVILDELGSKTDPSEGEALAKAILDELDDKKVIALVTTHYVGIKDFAKESSSIILASMSFNETSMEPTYKLILNIVGRSYALEISKKLGLSDKILNKARLYKNQMSATLEQLIDSLNKQLKVEETKINELNNKTKELEGLKQELAISKQKMERDQEKILKEYEQKQEQLLEESRLQIEEMIRELENKNKDDFKLHHKTTILKKLDEMQKTDNVVYLDNQELKIGDYVYIEKLHRYGILKEIKNKEVVVDCKNNTIKIAKSEVKKVKEPQNKEDSKVSIKRPDTLSKKVALSLNVVGYRVVEALEMVDNYLDEAMLCNYASVTIIHGTGTGTLKKAIQEHLKTKKYVVSFRNGEYGEGGYGVTIVNLKKEKQS